MAWSRRKVRIITEDEATGEIRDTYADIKQTLGIPHVSLVFKVFASFPEFFSAFWKCAHPMLQTGELFSAADQVRDEAHKRIRNAIPVPDFRSKLAEMEFTAGAQEELNDVVDLYDYINPVLLLLTAALRQGLEHPEGAPKHGTFPPHHPTHPERPILVDERIAPEPTRKLYDDIKNTLGTPFLNTSYITFGRWPDFLREYWSAVKPLIGSPAYEEQLTAIRQLALDLANDLPESFQLSAARMEKAGVPKDEFPAISQTTTFFLDLLSKQVLNMTVAKIGLAGGAQSSAAA